ncbi:spore germination protein GerPE [Paenibacillus sacheonensis]|uniref:Spore germination protein GerPE n=1 Tax=Paenibacillus sacheonensis TaxID=742054 RepID=A0A7X4YRD0_9BACL|nr:spore germination protein GerPE [Paenibacillus sacheonensis]MBM7563573.1 spore germination protein PE [Paenibacillus sacheonensis]NBC71128.1 spore germination protein GerPE [Paenibacillus sacheonensis]
MKRNAGPDRLPAVEDSDYPVRVSEVGGVCLTSIGTASIAQFGDRADVNAFIRGIAVQRESDHLDSQNVYFESYDIFNQPVPPITPWLAEAAKEPLEMRTTNREPRISVGSIEIIAVSSSALVLVGNGVHTRAESRISNIRQFAKPALRYYGTGCCPPATPCPRN